MPPPIHANNSDIRGAYRRRSPGVFFWVVGPMLLVVLGMFSSSPQCVLNPSLSCTQNWQLTPDGTLTVWLINSLWLKCARLTLLAALSVVLSALIYHITLALRGVTPITPFVLMGAMCAIFIPPTLFLMFSKFLSRNLMVEAAPAYTVESGERYHLFAHGAAGQETILLATEQRKMLVELQATVLASLERNLGQTLGHLTIFPESVEQQIQRSSYRGMLKPSVDGDWLYAIVLPHYLVFAVNLQSAQVFSGPLLNSLSPFVLIERQDTIGDEAQQAFLKAVYEQQPEASRLWRDLANKNPAARLLLARMLPLLDRSKGEAAALAQKLLALDHSPEVQNELQEFVASAPAAPDEPKDELPSSKNFLDLDPTEFPLP